MASQPASPGILAPTDTLPVVEVFGPTIQGEGALAGLSTYFVRLGYCDYRCSWCDSMYAVDPELVHANAERLTPLEIGERLRELDAGPEWVTLSGGNPAIHDLGALVETLHDVGFKLCVETQGSFWRDWLTEVDMLTVSPKPPSSGMATPERIAVVHDFMEKAETYLPARRRALKIVVFDEFDLAWASLFLRGYRDDWEHVFISVGTDAPRPGEPLPVSRAQVCDRTRWLFEHVASDPKLSHVRVLPQLHVLAWGHARAV
jgi:7-carboxy-7-deazaguanine synthase